MATVVEVPQLGTLVLRVPLPEVVAEAEHALLGAGLLLVATGTAEHRVVLALLDAAQQGGGLEAVAAGAGTGVLHERAGVDVVLHARHEEAGAHLLHHRVAERDHLGEVVPGVDVHHRERHPGGRERLHGQVEHDDGVLAAREQQHRPLELGRHLPDDVDGLRLEGPQVRQLVGGGHGRDHGKSRPDW